MEDESDQVDAEPRLSGVRISITRASTSDDEGDLELTEKAQPAADSGRSIKDDEVEKTMKGDEEVRTEQLRNRRDASEEKDYGSSNGNLEAESRTSEDEEMSKAFENGVIINEEADVVNESNESKPSKDFQSNDGEGSPAAKNPAMEMIGDRVLIERDGKFELVDVNEIKAEYFDMLGISPEKSSSENTENEASASEISEANNNNEIEEEKPEIRPRPKTTSAQELHRKTERQKSPRRVDKNRSQSAQVTRRKTDEYAYVKSIYAMTEQQLEIKRKREEAIARRRKEEEQREREEKRRKREDAERAFQAWLMAKTEEAKEMQRLAKLNQPDPNIGAEKAQAAQVAYNEWLETKRKQSKASRLLENSRKADEAAQYIIRDRELCDEAFRRWLKKKKEIARAKSAASKKKKPKLKRKEQPPHNSHKIRYYEYYGYRNNVAL